MPIQYPPSGLLTQRQSPGFFEQQKQKEQQQQLLRLKLQELRSQIGLRGAQQTKETAQAQQLAAISELLKGTSLGEFEPTFGPTGVTLRPRTKPAAAERKAIAETESSLDMLNNLRDLFVSSKTEVGPVTGRISPTAGLFGKTTQEQEDFMAATSAFKNKIIKEITGAQMSEPEAKRIMKQVPDITDPPKRWRAKWSQTVKNLKIIRKRREEVLRASGVKVPAIKRLPIKQSAFKVGEIRTDRQGKKREYIGNGQWQLVK